MTRMTIKGATTKVLSATLGGTPVAALKDWFDFAKGQKNVIATTDNGISGIELNSEDVSISPVLLALSEGFAVDNAPIALKMEPSIYAANVPVGISNRLKEDGETVRTWSEWHAAVTHDHKSNTAIDGDRIVYGDSFGSQFTSAELSILLGSGYHLMMAHEVPAILPQGE